MGMNDKIMIKIIKKSLNKFVIKIKIQLGVLFSRFCVPKLCMSIDNPMKRSKYAHISIIVEPGVYISCSSFSCT